MDILAYPDVPSVEPPAEPLALSPAVLDLAQGHSLHVGHGVGHRVTKLQILCACCNSDSGLDEVVTSKAEELNEIYPDYKNRSLGEPGLSEQVP